MLDHSARRILLVPDQHIARRVRHYLSINRHNSSTTHTDPDQTHRAPHFGQQDAELVYNETMTSFRRLQNMEAGLGNLLDADEWSRRASRLWRCTNRDRFVDPSLRNDDGRERHPCKLRHCPYCSLTRAFREWHLIERRLEAARLLGMDDQIYFITLTHSDPMYRSLHDAYEALSARLKELWESRAMRGEGLASATSIEFKRGGGLHGGAWHVHAHALLLVPRSSGITGTDVIERWLSLDPSIDRNAQDGYHVGSVCQVADDPEVLDQRVGVAFRYNMKVPQIVFTRGTGYEWRLRPSQDIDRDFEEAFAAIKGARLLRKRGFLTARGLMKRLGRSSYTARPSGEEVIPDEYLGR